MLVDGVLAAKWRLCRYVSHEGVEHTNEVGGFLAASHLEWRRRRRGCLAAEAPVDVLHSTVLVWEPTEPQVDAEQAPHDELYQLYISHAGVEHNVVGESLLAASHFEAAAAAPLAVLHSTTRV